MYWNHKISLLFNAEMIQACRVFTVYCRFEMLGRVLSLFCSLSQTRQISLFSNSTLLFSDIFLSINWFLNRLESRRPLACTDSLMPFKDFFVLIMQSILRTDLKCHPKKTKNNNSAYPHCSNAAHAHGVADTVWFLPHGCTASWCFMGIRVNITWRRNVSMLETEGLDF